jgi:hypothetical protein
MRTEPRVFLLPGKEGDRTPTLTQHHGQKTRGHVKTNEKRVQVMPVRPSHLARV